MRGCNPCGANSRPARREIAAIVAQDKEQLDDDFEVDRFLIEPLDLEAVIDHQRRAGLLTCSR